MKLFLVLAGIIVLNACNHSVQPKNNTDDKPAAFEDKKLSLEVVSKSRLGGTILDRLYDEVVEKNAELQALEGKIDAFYESRRDSVEMFNAFDSRNLDYYAEAKQHLAAISDSALRNRVDELLNLSNQRYDGLMLENITLLKQIESKSIVLKDFHIALKIVSTLPVIEKYQKGYLPDPEPLQELSKHADEAIKESEASLKKTY